MNILCSILPPAAPDYPLLGVAALVGSLSNAGHTCSVLDTNIILHAENTNRQDYWQSEGWTQWSTPENYPDWLSRVVDDICTTFQSGSHFDGLALSVTSAGLHFAYAVVRAFHAIDNTIPILLGGPAFFHESDVRSFATIGNVSICQGEGDLAILQWVEAIRHNRQVSRIFSQRVARLDELPLPDFTPFTHLGYTRNNVLSLETSRGCTNNCAFCDDTQMWGKYRMKSPERVALEIAHYRPTANHISFCDSLFNPSPARALKLATHIAHHDITWDAMMQCRGLDHTTAQHLSASGCQHVFLGVESFTSSFLNKLNKTASGKHAQQALWALHQAGIQASIGIIVAGNPLQSRKDFENDLYMLAQLAPCLHSVSVNPLCIPQGTPLWSNRDTLGIFWPSTAPWQLWHGGKFSDDVVERMAWCIEAAQHIQSLGVGSTSAIESMKRHAQHVINKAQQWL